MSPGPKSWPAPFIIEISVPVARPTEPGLRLPGGSGLLAIWCAASVIPYASITGTPKVSSNPLMTCGGSEDDDDLIKRSAQDLMMSTFFAARDRIAWCMVGTAVYQV